MKIAETNDFLPTLYHEIANMIAVNVKHLVNIINLSLRDTSSQQKMPLFVPQQF
jgi:hypothetical protein